MSTPPHRNLPALGPRKPPSLLQHLGRFFVRGLLVSVPVFVTVYVLYVLLAFIDRFLGFGIPGLGVVVILAIIVGIGYLASNIFTRWVIDGMELLFSRMPFVRLLYHAIKDLIGAFVGDQRRFDRPVRVHLPTLGDAYILGFITSDDLHALDLTDHVAVYIPQSYNFAGNLLLVPRSHVVPLTQKSTDVMTFIVSGGVSTALEPEALARRN